MMILDRSATMIWLRAGTCSCFLSATNDVTNDVSRSAHSDHSSRRSVAAEADGLVLRSL